MKVSSICDQGSASCREDGLILTGQTQFFGVLDGVSAPYGSAHPMQKFNGQSGGEMVARTVEMFFSTVSLSQYGAMLGLPPSVVLPPQSLEKEIFVANAAVREAQRNAGLSLDDAGELPGATFAIAKVGIEEIEIVQGGDCFALCVSKDGKIRMTMNHVRRHDTEMNDIILRLQRKIAEEYGVTLEEATKEQRSLIRAEMWGRFYPILKEARRRDANSPASFFCYPLLNGQEKFKEMLMGGGTSVWRISVQETKALLLFTDGMVPWEAMKGMTDEEVARMVYTDYQKGGLPYLLAVARGIEKKVEAVNYTDSAEATAIAIEF